VLSAFVPQPKGKDQVNHIDGVKTNNNLDNLEWVTGKENMRHSFDLGLEKGRKGEEHNMAKLSNEDVLTIRKLYAGGITDFNNKYSQRELARRVGISNSSLNDIENGRVAKPDPEILKRIAEELDLSLQQLLKAAGYNEVMSWFSHDEFKNKSTKDLKNTIEECRLFKYDILDWDANKRKKALKIMQNLNEIKLGLRLIKEDAETDYTIDKALEDIDKEIQELKDIATKYDYSKLPKDI
jgi:transcriptional regulator with XRE-family HTH domain